MTDWTYCPERLDTTPGHACMCTKHARHDGPHECVCGHTWGDWNTMTYDQQRAWLGLPELSMKALVVYTWLPGDEVRHPWVIWHANECTPLHCACGVNRKEPA